MDNDTTHADTGAAPVFPQALVDALRAAPDAPAFEYEGRSVSRAALLDLVVAGVHGLRAAGLGRGRTVALRTGVTPQGFALQIAGHLLGCRVIGLRAGMAPAQLAHVLAGGVHAVVTDTAPGEDPDLVEAAASIPLLHTGHGPLSLGGAPASYRQSPESLVAHGRPEDIALVTLTSGSTGTPKGVERTYASYTAEWPWRPAGWTPQVKALATHYQRFLLFGTLTSAVMFKHLGFCLNSGGTAVIPPVPFAFPQVLADHRPTAMLMTVPRLHHLLDTLRAEGAEKVDTSSLRALHVAGSPLTPHRFAEAVERLGPVVYQGYGQTEAGLLTVLTPDDIAERGAAVLDSVGRAWADVRIKVLDGSGAPVPTGATGEIWVHSPGALTRYVDDERETREVLSEDGWVRTRDLGHLDADGFLRLTGRTRDVVIVNAVLYYTGPVERVLAGHPDVDTAHVVTAPDERTGEAAHAFVVPAGERRPDTAALRTLVAEALGESSVPATITVVPEVPVAPSGKPDRRALLEKYGPGGRLGGPGND
ncbi:AMP-dependent synthetase [Streptomyces sulfonofaciens]|uniref:AMP-dependent synthetase n=1 Tax=Streptomyces sulfonofaciens TaxID=68272 RepID=A0A919FXQ7_9ACTN|nr:long-chain fatty acid--CoA ligase [Streptomyces sulfonofaciens]GHH73726.1 AMP-dependent synthetase [Streptomyces sulfonofaciens]